MSGIGTRDKTRLWGLKRVTGRLAMALAVVMGMFAFSIAVVAPPASAAAGELAGTWTSVDLDGSNQTLRITGAGNPVYAVFLHDDLTSGVCGGASAKLVGHGVADGNELLVQGTLVCVHGGNPIPGERIVFTFEYDEATDELTDFFGVVWERAD